MSLTYTDAGKGTPLVLIHAFPLSRAMWKRELEQFAPAGRVIAPDLPGFGGSPRQPHPSIEGMAQDTAALLDQLKVYEPVAIAGLSMGGYVALEFVRQFPQRVKALGLFSTRAAADTPEQAAGRMKLVDKLRTEGIEVLMTASLPKLIGRTTAASKPGLVKDVETMIRAASPDGVIDALRAMAQRRDSTLILPGLACPVLIVAGEEDALIPAQESQGMAKAIKNATLEIIPQAGHLANLEQPEEFHHRVSSWLRGTIMA